MSKKDGLHKTIGALYGFCDSKSEGGVTTAKGYTSLLRVTSIPEKHRDEVIVELEGVRDAFAALQAEFGGEIAKEIDVGIAAIREETYPEKKAGAGSSIDEPSHDELIAAGRQAAQHETIGEVDSDKDGKTYNAGP